jgi:hypothetical protein
MIAADSSLSLSLSLMSFVSHLCLLCAEGNGLTQDFSFGSLVSSSLSLSKENRFSLKLFSGASLNSNWSAQKARQNGNESSARYTVAVVSVI